MARRWSWRTVVKCTTVWCLLMCLDCAISNAMKSDDSSSPSGNFSVRCKDLRMGQYYCADPSIDPDTQQPLGCTKELQRVQVNCYPAPEIFCDGQKHDGTTAGFDRDVPCKYTNGKKFSVALILSVFFGMFGVDRFYLGYPAIGLLKLCTFGFMLLGQLVDIILIGLQVVGPADGSHYIIDYYGPGLINIGSNNETYVKPQYEYEYDYNVEL